MFLEIEPPRVETPGVAEGGKLPGREDCFQEFTSREGEHLSDIDRKLDTKGTNSEVLVDKRSVNCRSVNWVFLYLAMIDIPGRDKDRSDEPSTEGACGHRGIIVVVNHSMNFGVWRVLVK